MKYLVASILLAGISSAAFAQTCRNRIDPKKVVLMLTFNELGEEVKGAREGACARGERLVILPQEAPEAPKSQALIDVENRLMSIRNQSAEDYRLLSGPDAENANQRIADRNQEMDRLREQHYELLEMEEEKSKAQVAKQLQDFASQSKANGVKVSSFIVSGHDGGGHFYGDNGETTIAEINGLTSENPEVFKDVSSLLLMGCWSGTPDQVDQWKMLFPKVRILGGFVGSAPASTRVGAGTYISGLLKGERNLPRSASRSAVQNMLNQVRNLNAMTSGIYIAPNCVEAVDQNRNPAYYYVSPAQMDNELPETVRSGLSNYISTSSSEELCVQTFEENYDWDKVMSYFSGEKEPDNSQDLRSIYSYLRNNEFCFKEGFVEPAIDPSQVLFLRFYQDTKKNFGVYHKAELEKMYKSLDVLVEASGDEKLKAEYLQHKKLTGETLFPLKRAEANEEISKLTRVFDKIASAKPDDPAMPQIRKMMERIDTQLYNLKCVPDTWHEYVEDEAPARPSC